MLFSEESQGIVAQLAGFFDLPKIIHFVWAGGIKQMPVVNQERIMAWIREHRDFKVYIWVDYKTAIGNSEEQKKLGVLEHFQQITKQATNLEIKDVNEDLFLRFQQSDEIDKVSKFFNYEINRLRPNYGASSDILRYSVLYNYGGAYFDSDVLVGGNKLSTIAPFEVLDKHMIFIDSNSQNSGHIGNDAFITTKNNPVIKQILKKCIANYYDFDTAGKDFDIRYDNMDFIRDCTPWLTGPRVVESIVLKDPQTDIIASNAFSSDKVKEEEHGSLICQLDTNGRNININDQSWIGKSIKKALTEKECLDSIINASVVEYRDLKLLRINDHFYNYYESVEGIFPLEIFLEQLQNKLGIDKLDFCSIKMQELHDLDYWQSNLKRCSNSCSILCEAIGENSPEWEQVNNAIKLQQKIIDGYKKEVSKYVARAN